MAIEKKQIPFAPFKGLYLDGVTVPGGLSKAENVIILPDGTAERRPYERTLTNAVATQAGRGLKCCYELLKSGGETRYIFADVDASETITTSFGAEKVSAISGWTPTAGWSWDAGGNQWDHASGTTALVAGMATAIEATKKYRAVMSVTFPTKYGTSSNWTYASTDSGQTWTTETGGTAKIWLNTWTHANGLTVALNASDDFTTVIGESYVVKLYVTHTSGTGLAVYCGGVSLGTIASSGYHTFIARYATDTTGLRLVPSSNWVGSVEKTVPRVPSKIDKWCSVVKLVDPAGPNLPSNYDYTEGTYGPKSLYLNGAELLYNQPIYWYAEAAASLSQSVALSLGGTAAGTITKSGVYSYDVTAGSTTAPTITPTTSWTGSINSLSVQEMDQSSSTTVTKVIGGEVTGTDEYELSWADVLTDLETGDSVIPQWATLQDRAFRVDGINNNYWFSDASGYHNLGVPSPADAPVTASTTGGELLAGDYNVYYTYVKKYPDGYTVEGNPGPVSPVTVAGTAITVAVVACTDVDVTNIRIYRTLYGEPGSFAYRCEEVKNATATVTLTSNDDLIRSTLSALEFNHDQPPLGKYVLGAGSRLWIIDTDGTLHWSTLDNPEIMPAMNYQTFDPKDGNDITGMCAQKSHILVFKRNKTWSVDLYSTSVSEDGTAALARNVVSAKVGCIAPGSIRTVGNESAIWLSEAGFIYYNGGTMRNISAGGTDDGGNAIPPTIQTVVDELIADGAANFISSAYHTSKHLYHVNFITRDADGDEITAQRHFVYNIDSQTWTEYAFYNANHEKVYETAFVLAHDSIGREILLTPYLATAAGTSTSIFQINFNAVDAADVALDHPGSEEGGKLLYLFVDADGTMWGVNRTTLDGGLNKTTSAGVNSQIIANSALVTLFDTQYSCSCDTTNIAHHVLFDEANDCFYLRFTSFFDGGAGNANMGSIIFRITTTGTVTTIKKFDEIETEFEFELNNTKICYAGGVAETVHQPIGLGDMALNADGDTLFAFDRGTLYKITDLDSKPVSVVYYTITGYVATTVCLGMGFYGDNLYVHYIPNDGFWGGYLYNDTVPTGTNTHWLGRFFDVTGTANFTSWQLATTKTYTSGISVVSDDDIYLVGYPKVDGSGDQDEMPLYKMSYNGTIWNAAEVGEYPVALLQATPQRIFRNSDGIFYYLILQQSEDINGTSIAIHAPDWEYLGFISSAGADYTGFPGPMAMGTGSVQAENTLYISGYDAGT